MPKTQVRLYMVLHAHHMHCTAPLAALASAAVQCEQLWQISENSVTTGCDYDCTYDMDTPSSPTIVNSSPPPSRLAKAPLSSPSRRQCLSRRFGPGGPGSPSVRSSGSSPHCDHRANANPCPPAGHSRRAPLLAPPRGRDAYAFGSSSDPDAEWSTFAARKRRRGDGGTPRGVRHSGKFKLRITVGSGQNVDGRGGREAERSDASEGGGGGEGSSNRSRVVMYVPPPRTTYP
jgi:hypothetical protein